MVRAFERGVLKMEPGDQARYINQYRYFLGRFKECLDAAGLRVETAAGQPYNPGIALTPLNLADFAEDEALEVDQCIEPAILGPEGIVRMGTVTLRKAITPSERIA
jgi:hypothetical protein